MLERTAYLDKIKDAGNEPRVKLIAGIRHGGKSFLFYQFISELKLSGIDDEHIVHLNFESPIFGVPRTVREVEAFIGQKTGKSGKYYIFFDEIQRVSGWEKLVNALLQQGNFDIYVSISDAAVLLKKPAKAAAREKKQILINFKPFSFSEYMHFFAPEVKAGGGLLNRAIAIKNSETDHFDNYMRYGGFPAVYTGLYDSYTGLSCITEEDIKTIAVRLNGIYSSILLNDVIRRSKIRNLELLEQIINNIFCNIGNENSTRNIVEGLKKSRHKKNLSLVVPYIKALENAFIIKKVFCCNLSTGKILRTNAKFFIGDHALLNTVIGIRDSSVTGILKNILMQDLERREYTVYTGKFGDKSVDFVAKRGDAFVLLQTVDKNTDANMLEEKIEGLKFFNDDEVFAAKKKYVIFLDADASFEREPDGVIYYISLRNFLLLETI